MSVDSEVESYSMQSAFCIGLILVISIGLGIYFVWFNARVDDVRERMRACETSCTIQVLKRRVGCLGGDDMPPGTTPV